MARSTPSSGLLRHAGGSNLNRGLDGCREADLPADASGELVVRAS